MNFRKIKRNFRRNTKAISPVIATLLMIAIAVVASLVVYAWVMGYMSFTTGKTGKAMQIQSVAYDTAGSTMTIYVQNIGDSSLNFASTPNIYINGTAVLTTNILTNSLTASNNVLSQGNTATFKITQATTSASPIAIKVTDKDGTIAQLSQNVP